MSEPWFAARVGRGSAVHEARDYLSGGERERETRCGHHDDGGYIVRCDLEPVTCLHCVRARAANSHPNSGGARLTDK